MRSEHEDSFSPTDAADLAAPADAASEPDNSPREAAAAKPDIVEEVLIEEVSIDGMCGVY
jgi:mycofactocin precursor